MTDKRPLFVGEAPGLSSNGDGYPLYPEPDNSAGARLYRLTPFYRLVNGINMGTKTAHLQGSCRLNLIPEHPGKTWQSGRAAVQATNLLRSGLLADRLVILVGTRIRQAFYPGLMPADWPPCEWKVCLLRPLHAHCQVAWMPHPSGRNLWYNDEDNVMLVKNFLKKVFLG